MILIHMHVPTTVLLSLRERDRKFCGSSEPKLNQIWNIIILCFTTVTDIKYHIVYHHLLQEKIVP